MVYPFEINGLSVKTEDLICTVDGGVPVIPGQSWRLFLFTAPRSLLALRDQRIGFSLHDLSTTSSLRLCGEAFVFVSGSCHAAPHLRVPRPNLSRPWRESSVRTCPDLGGSPQSELVPTLEGVLSPAPSQQIGRELEAFNIGSKR